MIRRTAWFAVWTLIASASVAHSQEIKVELKHDKIYEGDSVQYNVLLSNFDESAEPDLNEFKEFDVKATGSGITVRQFGRSIRRTRVFEYLLTPHGRGVVEVPSPTVEQDGQSYRGDTVMLTVAAAEEQDVARLEVTASREEVYPMQPFEVRLTIAVKSLPEPHENKSPVSVQDPAPRLSIPWAEDDQLPDGLVPKVPVGRWLGDLQNERSGFSVNNFTSRGGFGGLFSGRLVVFEPRVTRALRKDARGARIEYWEYVFARTFVPTAVGEYNFGPVRLKGDFATKVNTRGNLQGEEIYAVAKSIRVRVKDVSTDGRLDSYTGAVGKFRFTSEISPREAKVGDPMTLTLSLTGVGTLDRTLAPDLNQLGAIESRFKVYDATEETEDSTRRFTYSVRPKHADVTELPAVPISYFDVDDEKFVTIESDAIPIKIEEANRLSNADIAMATPQRSSGNSVEVRTEGIFANVTDLRELRDEAVHPDRWFLSLGGLAGLLFVVALATQHVQTLRADIGLQRRRGAVSAAKQRFEAATQTLSVGENREGVERLSSTLLGLVADVCDLEPGGLTAQDAIAKLETSGIEQHVIEQFISVMQDCDGARYGVGAGSSDDLVESVERCVDELVRGLKARRLLP